MLSCEVLAHGFQQQIRDILEVRGETGYNASVIRPPIVQYSSGVRLWAGLAQV